VKLIWEFRRKRKLIFSNWIGFNHNDKSCLKIQKNEQTGNLNEGSTELVCTCVENRRKNQGNLLVSEGKTRVLFFHYFNG
jgi:hypothetical protein